MYGISRETSKGKSRGTFEEISRGALEEKKTVFFLFLEKNIIFLMVSESAQKKSQVNFHLSTAGKRFDSSAQ